MQHPEITNKTYQGTKHQTLFTCPMYIKLRHLIAGHLHVCTAYWHGHRKPTEWTVGMCLKIWTCYYVTDIMVCWNIIYCNVKSILQACVIMDLVEQVTKMSSNSESYLIAPSQDAENDVLLPEECLGIQVAIRLGTQLVLF